MTETRTPGARRYLIIGVVVLSVALWLILDAAGVGVPSLARFWPIFPLLGGLASLFDYFLGSRVPAALGKGVGAIGFSALFFALAYDAITFLPLMDWLPAIPLIIGLSFLATWVAGNRKPPLLAFGLVLAASGLTGFASRYGWFEKFLPSQAIIWAVVLLVIGAFFVWRYFTSGKRPGNQP